MLGSGIGYDLEIVHSIEEWAVRCDGPEVIVGFIQEGMSEVRTEGDLFRRAFRVPCELSALVLIQVRQLIFDRIHLVHLVVQSGVLHLTL